MKSLITLLAGVALIGLTGAAAADCEGMARLKLPEQTAEAPPTLPQSSPQNTGG